jgi:WD40 repeat protein
MFRVFRKIGTLVFLLWLSAQWATAQIAWDPVDGKWVDKGSHPSGREYPAAFSPDSRNLAFPGGQETIRLWDVATAKEKKKISCVPGAEEKPHQLVYTRRGDLIVLLFQHKGFKNEAGWFPQGTTAVCLWNLSSGKRSPFIKKLDVGGVAICPDGKLLANGDNLWNVATGERVHKVALPSIWVGAIRFSPDGKTMVYSVSESIGQDFAVLILVDSTTGKKKYQIGEIDWENTRGKGYFGSPVFSPDSRLLAFMDGNDGDEPLHIWNVEGNKQIARPAIQEDRKFLGFLPDNRTVVTWRYRGETIHLRDTTTGKVRYTVNVGTGIDSILLSPDGRTVALLTEKTIAVRKLMD